MTSSRSLSFFSVMRSSEPWTRRRSSWSLQTSTPTLRGGGASFRAAPSSKGGAGASLGEVEVAVELLDGLEGRNAVVLVAGDREDHLDARRLPLDAEGPRGGREEVAAVLRVSNDTGRRKATWNGRRRHARGCRPAGPSTGRCRRASRRRRTICGPSRAPTGARRDRSSVNSRRDVDTKQLAVVPRWRAPRGTRAGGGCGSRRRASSRRRRRRPRSQSRSRSRT